MALPGRAARLCVLVRGFGLSPAELARHEQQLVMSTIKTAFQKQAMETHPDLVPADEQADASAKFVKLRRDYEEARKLLKSGVRLSESIVWQPQQPQEFTHERQAYDFAQQSHPSHPDFWGGYKPPPPEPVFDIATRIKGGLVVGSFVTLFCLFMREFLANSAGATMKWHPGTGVRRYGEIDTTTTEVDKPVSELSRKNSQVKVDTPPADSFYVKRRSSNAKNPARGSKFSGYVPTSMRPTPANTTEMKSKPQS